MNELKKAYLFDLNRIKETIRINQNKAMVYANSVMIMTCYDIGTIIEIINRYKSHEELPSYLEKRLNEKDVL